MLIRSLSGLDCLFNVTLAQTGDTAYGHVDRQAKQVQGGEDGDGAVHQVQSIGDHGERVTLIERQLDGRPEHQRADEEVVTAARVVRQRHEEYVEKRGEQVERDERGQRRRRHVRPVDLIEQLALDEKRGDEDQLVDHQYEQREAQEEHEAVERGLNLVPIK